MKKIIPLSFIAVASLYAAEIELSPISVEATTITQVSENAQVSADLAQAISASVPSIDMNRRSGIANDIYIRGQKRDNISVEVDGTKICGACVNRMDPPVSHILANQIDEIIVTEGPYDVENFGVLSGGLTITTKKPTKDLYAEVNLGYGSFNYVKYGATVSGGNDTVRMLVSASSESSDQYEDGDGNTIAEQIDVYAAENPAAIGTTFKTQYADMKAYEKKSLMAKMFVDLGNNQELRLGYTANRSDDVLYGNSKMDALYDDSNIYSIEYNIKDISDLYENINLQYYYSDVDHPMATDYRWSSDAANPANGGNPKVMKNWLKTTMQGVKLKNKFDSQGYKLLVGLDYSERTWDGTYYKNGIALTDTMMSAEKSIDDALTTNAAIFTKLDKRYGALSFSMGARFDSSEITHATLASNDYTSLGANIFTTYDLNNENRIFLGLGQASRVPDARELYFTGSMGNLTGTPDLDQTTNQEIDLGYELTNESVKFKIKTFYSKLSDYIYYSTSNTTTMTIMGVDKQVAYNAFENIDATIYGAEVSASLYATDELIIDLGMSYKKGEKDKALEGQTDTDLADIAPFRANLAINYEYMNNSVATLETQYSSKWSTIDSDNGEQELDAWNIVNLKVKHEINKNFDFTLGVNNLFDETYAVSNTYADLILITAGSGTDIMLMNEPGRYIYTNLTAKF